MRKLVCRRIINRQQRKILIYKNKTVEQAMMSIHKIQIQSTVLQTNKILQNTLPTIECHDYKVVPDFNRFLSQLQILQFVRKYARKKSLQNLPLLKSHTAFWNTVAAGNIFFSHFNFNYSFNSNLFRKNVFFPLLKIIIFCSGFYS